jgi:membrane AbrB-like protein
MLRKLIATVAALLVGGLGGLLFYAMHAPLPWTLGSLTAAAVVAVCGGRWLVPRELRDVARPVVGILAGSAFTPAVIASIAEWWFAVVFVAAYSLFTILVGYVFFRRLCRFDRVTSYFAAAPAGLGEMTLLGGTLGGNMRTLVLVHAIRITATVFTVPLALQLVLGHPIGRSAFPAAAGGGLEPRDWIILGLCGLAGYGIGKLVRFPGGIMITTMLASAAVHGSGLSEAVPPAWLVALVQVVIGAVAGARFAEIRWNEFSSTVLAAVLWAAVLLAMATVTAAVGGWIFDRSAIGLLLALAPGGMVEMTVITYTLGIDVAFVVTCQVCRNFFVLAFAPLIYRRLPAKKPGPPTKPPDAST